MSFLKNPFRRLSHSHPSPHHQPTPLITYHISELASPKDTLLVKPITSASLPSYTISLTTQKGLHDTINVTLTTGDDSSHATGNATTNTGSPTGHCLVHAVRGKFTDCTLSHGNVDSNDDNGQQQQQQLQIHRRGPSRGMKTAYQLTTQAHAGLRWVHERAAGANGGPAMRGFMETSSSEASRVLALVDGADDAGNTSEGGGNGVDGTASRNVIARFTGTPDADHQRFVKRKEVGSDVDGLLEEEGSKFGVLDVYEDRVALDAQWREMVVLSAVSVYAREEWNRRTGKKANRVGMAVGTWKGLMSTGIPVAGA